MIKQCMMLSILTSILILGFSLSGCERIGQITTPETTHTIKIGIIQPSGLAPSFTKGAALARTQVNNSGGLLGMQVEFIKMDNQGDRDFPDVDESVRIAKTLIEDEGVVAILGPLLSTTLHKLDPLPQNSKHLS